LPSRAANYFVTFIQQYGAVGHSAQAYWQLKNAELQVQVGGGDLSCEDAYHHLLEHELKRDYCAR
jgi:hypothetical protein